MTNMNASKSEQGRVEPRGSGATLSLRKRILTAVVIPFLVIYTLVTLFPFYVLFVRTFVGTKDATDLHLWIPPLEEISMDAELGNLSIFLNLDIKEVKKDLGIPLTDYIPARMTLRQISEKYDSPLEKFSDYFRSFTVYNGWIVLFRGGKIWPAAARSALITIVGLVGLNVLSILTGYALAGLRRRYQMVVYNLFLLQMVIPPMLIILPQFMVVKWFMDLFPNTDRPGFNRYAVQLLVLILLNIRGGPCPPCCLPLP